MTSSLYTCVMCYCVTTASAYTAKRCLHISHHIGCTDCPLRTLLTVTKCENTQLRTLHLSLVIPYRQTRVWPQDAGLQQFRDRARGRHALMCNPTGAELMDVVDALQSAISISRRGGEKGSSFIAEEDRHAHREPCREGSQRSH